MTNRQIAPRLHALIAYRILKKEDEMEVNDLLCPERPLSECARIPIFNTVNYSAIWAKRGKTVPAGKTVRQRTTK